MPVVGHQENGDGFEAHGVEVEDDEDICLGLLLQRLAGHLVRLYPYLHQRDARDAHVELDQKVFRVAERPEKLVQSQRKNDYVSSELDAAEYELQLYADSLLPHLL